MFFKYVVPSLALLAINAAAQTTAAQATPAANVKTVEEIVAKVNGEIVTRGELDEKHKEAEAAASQMGLKGQKLADFLKQADGNALAEEIDTMLLVDKGKDMPGVSVDADVTKFFNNMQAQYKFNDENKFHEWLQQQFGTPYEELRDRKKRELMAQKVVSYQVASRITVPGLWTSTP